MKHEIRIASPCSADWNRMFGDERVRYCPDCQLNVYNFLEMSDSDIEKIVADRDGRLCARFYQRSDGTMLSRNCPVGIRAAVQRVSSFASAALAAVLSVTPAFAGVRIATHDPTLLQIQPAQTGLSLEVVDVTGAVISKAQVSVVNENTKVHFDGKTDARGRLRLADLPSGTYEISVIVPGFKTFKQKHITVPARVPLKVQVDVATMGAVVIVEGPRPESEDARVCKNLSEPTAEKAK
jgi:hypothetical protein